MLTPQLQLVAALLLAAVVLWVLGYRIRFRREWHLIGLFDLRRLKNPEGFARWVGGVGLLLGSITFAAAALAYMRPDLNSVLGPAYTSAVLASTAALVLGVARYIA
ncbi:MAG: hypothetical protein HY700_05815 [Gemmatimonadetes bacterium]|nr:hypothetical protein [Gemmatimonadota bacterium]